ncbi:DUF6798 domain-containing protein [Sorangium sp. So ce1504]|uniref:DUF6798 domain-containing protein n=1 Tax=Sorangium sp. So ce1504 TaxID=3133337 RepID=UPI003F61389F
MSVLERIRDRAEVTLAAVVSLLFGASFGWNCGVNNQVVYMLGSLRLVHPDILARDWFATSTTHYHPAFKYLAAGLLALNEKGWGVGIAQTVVIAVGTTAVYFLLRTLVDRRHALPSFLLLVAFATLTRTWGPCDTYVFDFILQPSSLGSAAFLISVPLFVRGKWLASGIALAASGLFHANYLILFFGAYALAHLGLGVRDRRELFHRASRQLLPPLAVLALFAPMILATAGAKDARLAQEIYTTIRAPHHFVIQGREREFFGFIAWHLLGLGAALPLTRNRKSPAARLVTLILALVLVIWMCVGLSALAGLRPVTQLFAWRVAPHAELLLTALGCAGAVRVILVPSAGRRYGVTAMALIVGGLGVLALYGSVEKSARVPALAVGVVAAAALSRLASESARRFAPEPGLARARALWQRGGALVGLAGALAVLLVFLVPKLQEIRRNSSVLSGLRADERALYAWMQASTPVDAIFLTPPESEKMRFHGQRPIVVDWKSNPIVPADVLEWLRRLEAVTGRKVRGQRDLDGYDSLDEARVQTLRERYGVDYVVLRRGQNKGIGRYKTVYSNSGFTVLDVRE